MNDLFGGPTEPTDRLFFGVFPPPEVAADIELLAQDLRAQHGLKGRPHQPERSHVTLFHVGDYVGFPDGPARAAMDAAATVACAPFEVAFDRAASFEGRPKNRPYVLQGGEGLATIRAMRQQLGVALAGAGFGKVAATQFTPHVTLLYDDKLVAEESILPIRWTVTEFVLIRSLLGRTKHISLRRWLLA